MGSEDYFLLQKIVSRIQKFWISLASIYYIWVFNICQSNIIFLFQIPSQTQSSAKFILITHPAINVILKIT